MTTTSYYVQPMTGVVHTDPNCSLGTARYRTMLASATDAEMDQAIRDGRAKSCRRCGPQVGA